MPVVFRKKNGEEVARVDADTLRGADLSGPDLTGAKLAGHDLTGANLSKAILKRADLRGCCLWGVDLTDTDLTDARIDDCAIWSSVEPPRQAAKSLRLTVPVPRGTESELGWKSFRRKYLKAHPPNLVVSTE